MAHQHPSIESLIISFLVEKAIHRTTTTYQELAEFLNEDDVYQIPTQGNAMGAVLSPILLNVLEWCKKRGWPRLTVLVVRKSGQDAGLPGKGFWAALNLPGLNLEKMSRHSREDFFIYFSEEVYHYFKAP